MLGNFDEEMTGSHETGLFGIPTQLDSSQLCLLPVPWEVTTSYGRGTSLGPQAILEASPQIDLFDPLLQDAWKHGFHWDPELNHLKEKNDRVSRRSQSIIKRLEAGADRQELQADLVEVNSECAGMVEAVYKTSLSRLNLRKIVGIIGGDHSTPEGLMRALCERYNGDFSILHIDAHHDLRDSYQGFDHSHASIMFNVMNFQKPPRKLTQVGIRDYSRSEFEFAKADERIHTFYDRGLKDRLFSGSSWSDTCQEIIGSLTHRVYISFDIDGLSPEFCPSTGTPVPGGLSFDQACYLLKSLGQSGKEIIGFDLNEVSPSTNEDDWDGNVGARILFQLCSWSILSKSSAKDSESITS